MGQKCVVAEYYDVIVTLTKGHHFILLDVCVMCFIIIKGVMF